MLGIWACAIPPVRRRRAQTAPAQTTVRATLAPILFSSTASTTPRPRSATITHDGAMPADDVMARRVNIATLASPMNRFPSLGSTVVLLLGFSSGCTERPRGISPHPTGIDVPPATAPSPRPSNDGVVLLGPGF